MPEILQQQLVGLQAALYTPDYWWQIGVLLTVMIFSVLANVRLQTILQVRGDSTSGIRHIAVRSLQRLLWPLVSLILLLPATAVLERYQLPVQLIKIAVPVLTALAVVRFIVYLLRKTFTVNPVVRSSENVLGVTIWIVVILHLLDWLTPVLTMMDSVAFTLGEARISVLSALTLMIVIAVTFVLALWLAELLNRQVSKIPGVSPSFRVGVSKFSRFLFITIALLLAMNSVGIDLGSLAIFGGALGVGLGFGLQRIASNFISGFILVMDRSIKPGDIITVGSKFGWVQELNARYIVVRNRDGVDTLIPNENLITSEVINWSYKDPYVRVTIVLQVSYDDDPEEAMEIMLRCAHTSPRVLDNPEPTVRLTNFADSGIELQLRFWIADPVNGFAGVKSDINVAIWRAFKESGVTIPYPQRDLHIKSASHHADASELNILQTSGRSPD